MCRLLDVGIGTWIPVAHRLGVTGAAMKGGGVVFGQATEGDSAGRESAAREQGLRGVAQRSRLSI